MAGRMRRESYRPVYEEREVTTATDLCDAGGRLDPAAVGWSRAPLVRANLSGHWLRKKRWNFWNWISPRFVFSVTLADIDYAAFCYAMRPAECHGVQDFGRGIWPYRSFWNWGVASGVVDGVRIGVNVGGRWTTGTWHQRERPARRRAPPQDHGGPALGL
jgi:hypothetical protein